MTTALIRVSEVGGSAFAIYLPKEGKPEDIVKTLLNLTHSGYFYKEHQSDDYRQALTTTAGNLAAALIRELPAATLVHNLSPSVQIDFTYGICVSGNYRQCRIAVDGQTTFAGSFRNFFRWAATWNSFGQYLEHIVKFRYVGGSENGYRVIRVTSIDPREGHVLIYGKDLEKDEERCYRSDRIMGAIELVK